ncbi:hypothetical protein BZL41_00355 [Pseudomonas sp. PIC25]|nr:hypothetical protein BZL41_00355 [Pseudomonas sp. PIC25]
MGMVPSINTLRRGQWTCSLDFWTSNLPGAAGRAYYGYYTVGGNDYLGSLSGASTWVKQTASGYFEAGQCTD